MTRPMGGKPKLPKDVAPLDSMEIMREVRKEIFGPKTNVKTFEMKENYEDTMRWLAKNCDYASHGNDRSVYTMKDGGIAIMYYSCKELTFVNKDEIPKSLEKIAGNK